MTVQGLSHVEQIALSSSHAAWAGATASTFAAVVALGVAVWGARGEEGRRRRTLKDQELAFSFGMVGAFEMIKPLINDALGSPDGAIPWRRFIGMVDHAHTLAQAALGIQMFDM